MNHISFSLKPIFSLNWVLTLQISLNQNKITLDRDRKLTSGFHQFQECEVPKKLACLTPYEKFVTQFCPI